jgi:DUF177 domain-containing protein
MIAINVSQLLKLPPGTSREFSFDEPLPEVEDELGLVGPVAGQAALLRTSRGIVVDCSYHTSAEQECSRCLDPCRVELEGSFAEEFQPRVDVLTGHALPEQPESDELAISERHILDLTELLRQDILTRLPLQPLCRPDCPGLCLECGRELQDGSCSCQAADETASPFARLAELMRRDATGQPTPNREGV